MDIFFKEKDLAYSFALYSCFIFPLICVGFGQAGSAPSIYISEMKSHLLEVFTDPRAKRSGLVSNPYWARLMPDGPQSVLLIVPIAKPVV